MSISDADDPDQPSALIPAREGGLLTGSIEAPASGRQVRLRLTMGKETLEIVGPGGVTELAIVLTDRGPRLVIEAADVQINTVNRIAVTCETFEVTAREGLSLTGAQTSLVARTGDLTLKANDDVKVMGEQIRLNCDKPDEVPAWMEREIAAQLVRTRAAAAAARVPTDAHTGSTAAPASDAERSRDDD